MPKRTQMATRLDIFNRARYSRGHIKSSVGRAKQEPSINWPECNSFYSFCVMLNQTAQVFLGTPGSWKNL
jgi:hypothetical protein